MNIVIALRSTNRNIFQRHTPCIFPSLISSSADCATSTKKGYDKNTSIFKFLTLKPQFSTKCSSSTFIIHLHSSSNRLKLKRERKKSRTLSSPTSSSNVPTSSNRTSNRLHSLSLSLLSSDLETRSHTTRYVETFGVETCKDIGTFGDGT